MTPLKTHAAAKRHRPKASGALSDEALLDLVQRQTIDYFWRGGHPVCGLALDRLQRSVDAPDDQIGRAHV